MLHPEDPLDRARHRAWIELGSPILNDIAGFYDAANEAVPGTKAASIRAKLARLEASFDAGPYVGGSRFSLVDADFVRGAVSQDLPERRRALLLAQKSYLSAMASPSPARQIYSNTCFPSASRPVMSLQQRASRNSR